MILNAPLSKLRFLGIGLLSIGLIHCSNYSKSEGEFALLPLPQEIEFNGISELTPKNITSYFSSEDMLPPNSIPFVLGLKKTTKEKAQIVFSVDSDTDLRPEGYTLRIDNQQIFITAKDKAGLLYGFTTLEQLIEDAEDQKVYLPQCSIKDYPLLSYRAIHLDIKHHMEKEEYYYALMDRLRKLKINGIILEIEDKLAYPRQPLVGAPEALSVEKWKALSDYALERNIRISPLVQGLGHASFILKHEAYSSLRDDPESDWAFNPLDPNTYAIQFDLYRDALDAFPHAQYLHVGGDEVHTTGRGSDKSTLELQLYWLKKVSDFAEEQGRTPIFWDDMPLKFANVYQPMYRPEMPDSIVDSIWEVNQHKLTEVLDLFPKNCIYMRWNYHTPEAYGNNKAMQWFTDQGLKVMGATAGQTRWVLMPQRESNMNNISTFALSSIERNLEGLLLTLWDDDSPHFELYQRGIAAFGANTWSGDKMNKEMIKSAFQQRMFSPLLSSAATAFIDSLEVPVALWKNILLQGNDRNSLTTMSAPLQKGIISLPDANHPGQWSQEHEERLMQAKTMLEKSEWVINQIQIAKEKSLRNTYTLEIYQRVAEMTAFTPKLLFALKALDLADSKERQSQAFKNLFQLEQDFQNLRNTFESTYAETRILNKSKEYILDQDHHRHLANQSLNMDWQFNAERFLFEKIKNHPQLVKPESN